LWPVSPGSPHGEDLARSVKVKYISLTKEEIAAMKKQGPYLQERVWPPNTYYGQTEELRTIAVPVFFGVGAHVPESLVYAICKVLMDDPKRFVKIHRFIGDYSFESAFMASPPVAPFHPAVIKYLKDKGQWNDELEKWNQEAWARLKK
jgi:TRAP transporter TAXI family solute receptor